METGFVSEEHQEETVNHYFEQTVSTGEVLELYYLNFLRAKANLIDTRVSLTQSTSVS
jgi:hypothetical protein